MNKLVPEIQVVTRQPPNISQTLVMSRHWKVDARQTPDTRPPGCHRLHTPGRCVCCKRMEEKKESFSSTMTGRQYTISRHYTCQTSWVVYLVTCTECQYNSQYCGQTIQKMASRHYGHRSDIRQGTAGLGQHFKEIHGGGLDLSSDANLDIAMRGFSLTIIASVRPPQTPEETASCQERLDRLEADFMHRLRCMKENGGGLNLRNDNIRRRRRRRT